MYNVAYDRPDGTTALYCTIHMPYYKACLYLQKFLDRYGTGNKPYPNGRGFYRYTNARIVNVEDD